MKKNHNQNIKVTMEKYVIDWVKLTICRTNFARLRMVNTQSAETKQTIHLSFPV